MFWGFCRGWGEVYMTTPINNVGRKSTNSKTRRHCQFFFCQMMNQMKLSIILNILGNSDGGSLVNLSTILPNFNVEKWERSFNFHIFNVEILNSSAVFSVSLMNKISLHRSLYKNIKWCWRLVILSWSKCCVLGLRL